EGRGLKRRFGNKVGRGSIEWLGLTFSIFGLRIVEGKIKVGAVILGMALDATDRNRHKAIAFGGILGVSAAGAMGGFALDVGTLRRRIARLEPARFIRGDGACHGTIIELLIAFFKRGHGVGMAGVVPDIVFGLMALGALLDAGVGRGCVEKADRRSRSLALLGGLALLVGELSMGAGNLLSRCRVI